MQFVVPMAHRVAAMNGCHRDVGHQGQWQTLSLLQDWFWGPGIAKWMKKTISSLKGVFSMRVPEPGLHYKLFWSPLLWSCLVWILPALKQLWNWTNLHI